MPTNPGVTGLVSWWSLDETSGTRVDSHGSNDLTDNNTTLFGTGVQGNAASFVEANGEYFNVAHTANLGLGGDRTFCGWVRVPTGEINKHFLAKVGPTANKREFAISTNLGLAIKVDVRNAGDTAWASATTANTLTADTFAFFMMYYDATGGEVGISLDNGTVATAAVASVNATDGDLTLARFSSTFNPSMDALLDEVCVYSRVLSADEIAFLYNSGAGVTYATVAATGAPLLLEMMQYSHSGGMI